jgi:hypothetical protein
MTIMVTREKRTKKWHPEKSLDGRVTSSERSSDPYSISLTIVNGLIKTFPHRTQRTAPLAARNYMCLISAKLWPCWCFTRRWATSASVCTSLLAADVLLLGGSFVTKLGWGRGSFVAKVADAQALSRECLVDRPRMLQGVDIDHIYSRLGQCDGECLEN